MAFDVWEAIASTFTVITAILLAVPTFDIVYSRFLQKPKFEIINDTPIVIRVHIDTPTHQIQTRVFGLRVFIRNRGYATARNVMPYVMFGSSLLASGVCWIGSVHPDYPLTLQSPTELTTPDEIGEFLRLNYFTDRYRDLQSEVVSSACLCFVVEGGQLVHTPTGAPERRPLPLFTVLNVRVAGDNFRAPPWMYQKPVRFNSWKDFAPGEQS